MPTQPTGVSVRCVRCVEAKASPSVDVQCPIHVPCDQDCGALLNPHGLLPDEIWKAYVHWRYHHWLGGCAHSL